MGAVFLFVAFQYRIDLLIGLEVIKEKYASASGKYPWANHIAGLSGIAVGKDIIRQ